MSSSLNSTLYQCGIRSLLPQSLPFPLYTITCSPASHWKSIMAHDTVLDYRSILQCVTPGGKYVEAGAPRCYLCTFFRIYKPCGLYSHKTETPPPEQFCLPQKHKLRKIISFTDSETKMFWTETVGSKGLLHSRNKYNRRQNYFSLSGQVVISAQI